LNKAMQNEDIKYVRTSIATPLLMTVQ